MSGDQFLAAVATWLGISALGVGLFVLIVSNDGAAAGCWVFGFVWSLLALRWAWVIFKPVKEKR